MQTAYDCCYGVFRNKKLNKRGGKQGKLGKELLA